MAKIKTCKFERDGAKFSADLRVNGKGIFSITLPGTEEEWAAAGGYNELTGDKAEEVEAEWRKKTRDFFERTKTERKVLLVKFDSTLRRGGKKDFFINQDAMLYLRAAVALETKTRIGEKVDIGYKQHPDHYGMHIEEPFPWWMRLESHQFERDGNLVVEWTEQLQQTVARAGQGVQAVVEMLDDVFSSGDKLALASSRVSALPASSEE